jgi:uncharacterized protein YjiS (DUF1127 family)
MSSSTQAILSSPGSHAVAHATAHGLAHSLKGLWQAYWMRKAQRTTVFVLSGLDDRTLQDIGIDRSEIESLVYARDAERTRRYARS